MKIGIIGIGEIGSIFLEVLSKNYDKANMYISNRTIEKINKYEKIANIESNISVAKHADYLFLCVKPNQVNSVIAEISPYLSDKCVLLSVAAGITVNTIKGYLKGNNEVVRLLPNTPSKIGEGIILYTKNNHEKELVDMLQGLGRLIKIDENKIDLGSVSSGSMPAFVYELINAYTKAAVKNGLPEELATYLIANTFASSAKLMLESKENPQELIDSVCVEGGSTIEGMKELLNNNIEDIIEKSFEACLKKTIALGKKA